MSNKRNELKKYLSRGILFVLVLSFQWAFAQSQNGERIEAFDPANMNTKALLETGSYYFNGGHKFYSLMGGFHYGIAKKNLLSVSIPVVHTIYNADYGGLENTTGIGDIRFGFSTVLYQPKKARTVEKVTGVLEVTAPTGDPVAGRGAGAWLYKPGFIVGMRLDNDVTFYPEVRFQLSSSKANSRGGTDGLPDPQDPDRDEKLQNFSLNLPVTFEMIRWNGWLTLNMPFSYSFYESNYFLFLKTDFGKNISEKSAVSLQITKFIAGQPRLNVLVQAKLILFL
jgi:hypothetical protein